MGSWRVPKAETDPTSLSSKSVISGSASQLGRLILFARGLLLKVEQRQFQLSLGVRWVFFKPTFATLQGIALK